MGAAQRVSVAAAILAGGYLAGRILGLVRNMALGAAFGAGPELDAYFAAFRIPDLIFQLVAGAAMSSAFVPAFGGLLARGDENGAWTVANSVLTLVLAVSAALAALAFVLAPWLTPWLTPGFSPEQLRLTTDLTRIMLAGAVLFSASGILTGILNARRHFLLPAVAPLAYNAAIIGGALLAGPFGVFGPAWGAV
ncbi:MAG: murein biosynthesis integral membrane protein MurJ, partial [Chloroflexi bacterium]|nr:murein biosynthesis integral membrane protein MurJ [Chloroflexota bacterium]